MSDERSSGYYARIMGTFWRHPRTASLSLVARGLWVSLVSWSADQRSDGVVPVVVLPMVCGGRSDPRALAELERAELVERDGRSLTLRNWGKHNITREKHDREKERARNGMANKRGTKAGGSPSVTRNKVVSDGQPSDQDQDQDQDQTLPSGRVSDARDPEPMAPTATTARAESRTAGYERVRLALVAAYKAAGAMVPTRDLSVPHSSILMSLADAFDGDASAMTETIAGFFADQRAAKEGWPLSWLAKNPNAYRRRSGGGPGSPPTALPADLWDHERLVLSRALRGDWWKPGTKADRWYRALLARHPGIGPTPPEQAVAE